MGIAQAEMVSELTWLEGQGEVAKRWWGEWGG
jgi:hypothetical protein